MKKDNKKLQGKDFINVGIFGAIYFVIAMAVGMLGYIPVFVPLFCVITPIIGGVPFMLFLTKVERLPGISFSGIRAFQQSVCRALLLRFSGIMILGYGT